MPSSGAWPSGTADPVRGAADRRGRLPALLALVGVILCAGAVVGVVVLRRDRPRGPGEPPPASGPIAPSPEVGASSPVTSVDGGAVAGEAELAPEILAFGAQTSELAAGATTRLQVRVADGTAGQVWWRASCGAVARNPDAPTGAIFVAPAEPGLCTVTVEVENPTRTTRTTASQDIAILAAFAMEAADDVATP